MKKRTLILAFLLVLTTTLSIFADGETGTNNGCFHYTEGLAEVFCQICDICTGTIHP